MYLGEFGFNGPYRGVPVDEIGGVMLPEDYLAFMREHNGGEGDIGETYLVLFPMEELQTIYDNYDVESELPGCVIIGGDGGGELYGVDEEGRYFNVPAIIDKNDRTELGSSFEEFLENVRKLWAD